VIAYEAKQETPKVLNKASVITDTRMDRFSHLAFAPSFCPHSLPIMGFARSFFKLQPLRLDGLNLDVRYLYWGGSAVVHDSIAESRLYAGHHKNEVNPGR
jgi:hypothetical protein